MLLGKCARRDSKAKGEGFNKIGSTDKPNPGCLIFVPLVVVQPLQIFLLKRIDYLISELLLIRNKTVTNLMLKREVRPQGFEPRTF